MILFQTAECKVCFELWQKGGGASLRKKLLKSAEVIKIVCLV